MRLKIDCIFANPAKPLLPLRNKTLNQARKETSQALLTTIIDYGMGNLRSVAKAFEAIGQEASVSHQIPDIAKADALVLPGVGAFADGMANLKQLGLIPVLREKVLDQKTPFLGICLGMQLLAARSYEDGKHEGLGWIQGEVQRLQPQGKALKIPHMGWNDVTPKEGNPLYAEMGQNPCFYFLHSYHLVCSDSSVVIASCNYGQRFTVSLQQENIFGTQFHPEKSQKHGLQLLRNFASLSISDRIP